MALVVVLTLWPLLDDAVTNVRVEDILVPWRLGRIFSGEAPITTVQM